MEVSSQTSRFSTEPSTKGFDHSAGDKWIYPENYPLREYQFNIVKSALYHNTLVCLPTGLGKTFIAAVVMYNFWRWYPRGKIVFLAPTKPLVAQQINACNDIMGIQREETIELTGQVDKKKRVAAWTNSSRGRVIFATPQVFHKDLENGVIPTELIKCVIVDEAHKALGKHSYCESIRLLSEKSKYFRVVGLSATPGGKLDAVQHVIRNLHISRLELRDDTSPDITPYINERKLDIILVSLGGDLEKFKDRYIVIMDPHVRFLVNNNVLRGNTGNLSKGRIFLVNKEWQQKPNKGHNHGQITKTLIILLTMYHAYELLIRHGLRAFYNFYQKHDDKYWLNDEHALKQLLEEINYYLGPFPDVSSLPGESFPMIPDGIRFGHKKFYELRDLLLQHFQRYENNEKTTRAIVFVEFRDIVNEVYVLLLQSMPLLRPQKFVGQAGQKRSDQKKALEDFRNDRVNVLISTSVGEEGLDVGEVDLIVCFDITHVSPIRLVQRMGRTGRKRDGHIVVLVTDGKEHQTLKSSMSRRDSLNSKVLHSSGILSALYTESPRMVPEELQPECRKCSVIVPSNIGEASTSKGKTKETKKPRKRAEAGKKTKVSKNPLPSGSQMIMRFLKRTKENAETEVDNDIVELAVEDVNPTISQTSQISHCNNNAVKSINIKSRNVKLLTCDDAAVEFLTLCTMKNSQRDREIVDGRKANPYFPSYYERSEMMDLHIEIPDLRILDCLKTLKPYEEVVAIDNNDSDSMHYEENDHFVTPKYFNDLDEDFQRNDVDFANDSRFEALLDESTSDDDKTNSELIEVGNNAYPVEEKVDWANNDNANGFEDLMDTWSDETRMSDGKIEANEENKNNASNAAEARVSSVKAGNFGNLLHETSRNSEKYEHDDKNEWEKISEPENDDSSMKFGVFENLLNESETSSENDKFGTANNGSIDKSGAFEDLLNDDWNTSLENDDSDATIDGLTKKSAFENLLDDSTTKSEINVCSDKNFEENVNKERENSCDKSGAFEDLLDSTSIDSETQFNIDFVSKKLKSDATSSSRTNYEARGEKMPASKEKFIDRPQVPNEILISDEFIEEIDQESVDVLADYEPPIFQNSKTQKSQGNLITETGRISPAPANSTPKKSQQSASSMTLTAREPEAFERESTNENSTTKKFVNKERSNASSYTVRPNSDSRNSPCGENTLNRHSSWSRKNAAAERTESDEDIFEIDDLTVDSEFEEKIAEIENSAEKNVIKSDEENNCVSFAKGNIEKIVDFIEDRGKEFQEKQIVKEFDVSPRKSLRLELNLDDEKNEFSFVNPCEVNQGDSKGKEENDSKSSSKSLRLEIDCEDWSSEVFQVRRTNNSLSDEQNHSASNNESAGVKNSEIPDAVEHLDINVDDFDWDSNDFGVSAGSSKSSKNSEKILDCPELTRNWRDKEKIEERKIVDRSRVEKTTSWLTTRKPKNRMSLSKKLARNICNNSWTKRINEKHSPNGDSDSENDFTVSRLETTIFKDAVSDHFLKPNPVSALKRSRTTKTMNPSIGATRNPLSLRHNDVNKMELGNLKKISAPTEYNKGASEREANDRRRIGAGREKSSSCDLETRKRKRFNTHKKEKKRRRIKSDFIDDEAEVSSDADSSSGSSGNDEDLHDFVSYTQNIDDHVDMQAHYLQTVRSPRRPGGFYTRKPKSPSPGLQIYSQPVLDEPNNYIYDSFCVDENEEVFEESATSDELTKLEEFEMKRRNKKRKRTESSDSRVKRKRKVVVSTHDATSSEDETEKLRQQIREESFTLKNRRQ